jgi:hypothetical protein
MTNLAEYHHESSWTARLRFGRRRSRRPFSW